MMHTHSRRLVALSCLVLLIGCGCQHRPPAGGQPTATKSDLTDTRAALAAQGDLAIPRLTPKSVIWRDEWKGEPELPAARQQAKSLADEADHLKSQGDYQQAATRYQQAMQADPTWAYPPYQLACNYELANQPTEAARAFDKSLELGLDDFPTVKEDDELGSIRKRPDFDSILKQVRDRYLTSSVSRVGQPIALKAKGTKPAEGWPIVLMLHGYGDTNLSYLDLAEPWAQEGFVAVAVPGSIPATPGRYVWSPDSVEPTHLDLQAIITSPLLAKEINPQQVYLLGFSQGALHSLILTMDHPDLYAGVVALSPGGSLSQRLLDPQLKSEPRSGKIAFIYGDQEPHGRLVPIWESACQRAGWKFLSQSHPGGHSFPENWHQMQPRIAAFLTQ